MCTKKKNLFFVNSTVSKSVSGSSRATKYCFSIQQQVVLVHRTRGEGELKGMKADVEVALLLPDRRVTLVLLCFSVIFGICCEVTLNYLPRDI